MAERNIPQSKEAEKAVLGSAFLSKMALQKICDELSPEHFYSEANAKIFFLASASTMSSSNTLSP